MMKIKSLVLLLFFCSVSYAQDTNPGDYFFNTERVHDIRIYFTQCNYQDSLYFYKDSVPESKYMQANVTLNGDTFYACGVRIKGESSYKFYPGKKKSFKIKFNQYIKGQKVDEISTINLNNGLKDPSMMREKIFLDILKKEGVPAPKCTYANLYINDENYGLYTLVENVNSSFLKNNFGNKKGNMYKGEPQAYYQYFGEDPLAYKDKYISEISKEENIIDMDLVKLIRTINDTSNEEEKYVQQLDSVLNTDNLIKIFAITNILCNVDAHNMMFSHNQYLYHNTKTNKFEWIPYDANYAFCAWNPKFTLSQAEQLSLFYVDERYAKPLVNAIFNKKIYRHKYLDYSKEFLTEKYTSLYMYQLCDSLALKIRKYIYADSVKMYSNKEFEKNIKGTIGNSKDPGAFIPGVLGFYEKRREFLLREIRSYY